VLRAAAGPATPLAGPLERGEGTDVVGDYPLRHMVAAVGEGPSRAPQFYQPQDLPPVPLRQPAELPCHLRSSAAGSSSVTRAATCADSIDARRSTQDIVAPRAAWQHPRPSLTPSSLKNISTSRLSRSSPSVHASQINPPPTCAAPSPASATQCRVCVVKC